MYAGLVTQLGWDQKPTCLLWGRQDPCSDLTEETEEEELWVYVSYLFKKEKKFKHIKSNFIWLTWLKLSCVTRVLTLRTSSLPVTGLRASTPWSGLASCSYSGGGNKSLRRKFLFQSSTDTVKQDDESETWGSPAPQLFDIVMGLSSCLCTARTSPHRLWRYVVITLNCSYTAFYIV